MQWSVTNLDDLNVVLAFDEGSIQIRKNDIYFAASDTDIIIITINQFLYYKSSIMGINPGSYYLKAKECIFPVATDRDDLLIKLNQLISTGSRLEVSKNGTIVGAESAINFIEGSNITLTVADNTTTNNIDITIDSSGGGGGLPPDGTYGDVVVSGTGTIWTVTDDTSNQQVAVYEDGFIRGTRPSLNFYDDGGVVSVTVTDDSVNNRVDIGISTSIPTPTPVYLVAHDENTQTAASRDTGYPMSIDWVDEQNEILINAHTQITFNQDGVYNIQFSIQFTNTDTQLQDVDVWLAKNGTAVPWSNSRFTIQSTHGGDPGHHIAAWNFMSSFIANDFVELYWQTTDTQVRIEKIPASFDAPDTPSIILTVDKL